MDFKYTKDIKNDNFQINCYCNKSGLICRLIFLSLYIRTQKLEKYFEINLF